MRRLTHALERILHIWQQDREELVPLLLPGLSTEKIEEQLLNLPFRIPREVYFLYQWRNGILRPRFSDFVTDFLPGFHFSLLAEAVNQCQEVEEFRQEYISFARSHPSYSNEYCDKSWFPIFDGRELGHFIVLGDKEIQEFSPVLSISWKRDETVKLEYPSLANMMAVVAECYETGAYYIETQIIGNQDVESLYEDEHEVAQIRSKYNLEKLGVRLKERKYRKLHNTSLERRNKGDQL
jgi:hypothetical protein